MSKNIKNNSKENHLIQSDVSEIEVIYKRKVDFDKMSKITSPEDAVGCLRSCWANGKMDHTEQFVVLYLNRSNRVLGWSSISHGGQAGTVVDPKVIFQIALKANAASIILSHNHPSGNINPSDNDKRITDKLVKVGELLELSVFDHIILTSESFLSFSNEGFISK